MNVKRLKELIKDLPDDQDVYIRNSFNCCGNCADLEQVELDYIYFFGDPYPAVFLNTQHTEKQLERTGLDEPFFYEFVDKQKKEMPNNDN